MIDLTSPSPEFAERPHGESQQRLECVRRAISAFKFNESDLSDNSPSSRKSNVIMLGNESHEPKLCSAFAAASVSSQQKSANDPMLKKNAVNVRKKTVVSNSRGKTKTDANCDDSDSDIFQPDVSIKKKVTRKAVAEKIDSKKSEVSEMGLTFDSTFADSHIGIHLKTLPEEKNIKVFESSLPPSISGLIRWTARPKKFGGSCIIDSPNSKLMKFAVLVLDPKDFISWSCADLPQFQKFSELSRKIDEIQSLIDQNFPHETVWSIAILDREAELNKQMKNKKYAGINVTSILEEAEVFLLIEKRVSVYNFKKLPELGEYIASVTSELLRSLTRVSSSGLDFRLKKSTKLPEELKCATAIEQEIYKRRQGWINMLSTIHSISLEKSKLLATSFSCPILLRNIYKNEELSIENKKLFLQDKFYDFNKLLLSQNNKKIRMENILSNRLYQIFTSLDPETLFN